MAERWHDEPWAKDMWWSGKTTRRKFIGLTATAAGALGATMLVPAPWREAFGQAKPYKVGVLQPLTGAAAAGGKTALVGTQLATNRINKGGGINGRPVELVVADYESKPDVGRRKAEKLLDEDKVDVGEGGKHRLLAQTVRTNQGPHPGRARWGSVKESRPTVPLAGSGRRTSRAARR